jgi:lipopolysaccharide export LptBFGC system permease protein LptF
MPVETDKREPTADEVKARLRARARAAGGRGEGVQPPAPSADAERSAAAGTPAFSGQALTRHRDPAGRAAAAPAAAMPAGALPALRVTPWRAVVNALKWVFLVKPKFLIIERYMWGETFGNFLLGSMGFTFFMIITTIFALGEKIFSKAIPTFTVFKVLLLNAPGMLVLAIPVAVVFSTLMAMGRLNRDNEVVAMQTNGISLYRIFIPFVAMAIMAGILSWAVYEKVAPRCNTELLEVLKVFWRAQVVDFIKPGIVISAPQKKYFFVNAIHKEEDADGIVRSTMRDIRLYDYYKDESGALRNFPRIFIAKQAWMDDQYLVLSDVTLYNLDAVSGRNLVSAHMPQIKIDIGTRLSDFPLDPQPAQLTAHELRDRVLRLRDRLAGAGFLRSQLEATYTLNWTEYYFKYSIPFACLSFVLVAVPVSLRGPRDERNMGIIMTFILVMIYYILFFTARALGSRGVILTHDFAIGKHVLIHSGADLFPPYVAGWITPALFGIWAIVLILRARK